MDKKFKIDLINTYLASPGLPQKATTTPSAPPSAPLAPPALTRREEVAKLVAAAKPPSLTTKPPSVKTQQGRKTYLSIDIKALLEWAKKRKAQ